MSAAGNDLRSAGAARSVRAKPELPRDLIELPEAPARRNRKSKGERLRQLTDRLRQHSSLDVADPPPDDDSPSASLQRPQARAIVGSYIQRTIPFRSASFSLGENKSDEAGSPDFFFSAATEEEVWRSVPVSDPSPQVTPPPPPAPEEVTKPPPLTYNAVVQVGQGGTSQTPLLDRLACLVKSKSFDAEDKKARTPGSPDIRVDDASAGTSEGEWSWAPGNDTEGRLAPLLRNDSLSEGEAESGGGGGGGGPRGSRTSPGSPRRYNKRPLRGPYGQMLEAEMKRASPAKLGRELGLLEGLVGGGRPEGAPLPPRRKISAYQMGAGSDKGSSSGSSSPMVGSVGVHVHQRAASSPCQLMGVAHDDQDRSRDTRTHVVVELYETEKSYVEALRTLVTKYLNPLKNSENLIETHVVDEIFFQIPSILQHHEVFLEDLQKRLDTWDLRQKIGDLFLDFSRQSVVNCYTAFINNWQQAKSAISSASQSKPAFARFLEATSREHKGKLALDSLLIMPVQRIPRYELLIQTLLKHTSTSHPDHSYLVSAQRAIHELAMTINCREKESCEAEQHLQHLRDLENLLDGCGRLAVPDRFYIRHDAVTVTIAGSSKERMLFLFSDMLLIASVKRRSGTIRKPSSSSISSSSVTSTLEANKYKTLMKFFLADLDMVKARDEAVRYLLQEIAEIAEDCNLISRLMDVAGRLHCSHSALDETLRDMQSTLSRQLMEKQVGENGLNCLELSIGSQCENVALVFGKPEQREAWEEAFTEAKQKLVLSAEQRPSPEFLCPLAIRKTRAGLQFTCATATAVSDDSDLTSRDVWVCNSDGYVGQVCVLSLHTEPTVISCNGVCNSRILCIAAIPVQPNSLNSSNVSDNYETAGSRHNQQDKRLHFESSSTSSEDYEVDECGREVESSSLLEEQMDDNEPTMWLGTEDGFIHVYSSTDNIRIKKNKIKFHHGSSVHCILYLENRVYASLANGVIVIYSRDSSNQWNTNEPYCISVGSPAMPVTKMVCVGNGSYIWCACHNNVRILNTTTLQVECSLNVGSENDRAINCLVSLDLAVWVSLHNSASVRLYHGISMELLCEVSVAPAVTKMLATGCDDIIRQHKAACLRVTALLASQDLLWVGTSAGVILTIPTPRLNVASGKLPSLPAVIGVPHGHTGHVRFLTSVQVEKAANNSSQKAGSASNLKTLVISGGDGYEDFRSSSLSEIAGREDSTNHLLLWRL